MQALANVWMLLADVIPFAPTRIVLEGARQVMTKNKQAVRPGVLLKSSPISVKLPKK